MRDYCILQQSLSLCSPSGWHVQLLAVLCHSGHTAHSQVLYLRWPNPRCVEREGYNLPAVFWVVNPLASSVHTNGNLSSAAEGVMIYKEKGKKNLQANPRHIKTLEGEEVRPLPSTHLLAAAGGPTGTWLDWDVNATGFITLMHA